jgi:hypothetical protein
MMASLVREAAGPIVPVGKSVPMWVGKEWVSDDLGKELPTHEDFVIALDPSVSVSGIKNPPSIGTRRFLDLSKYGLDDLESGPGPVDIASRPSGAESLSRFWVLIIALNVLLLLIVSYFFWRRYRTVHT